MNDNDREKRGKTMTGVNKKKTTAILLGLTIGLTGTCLADPQTNDTDSRIAALEAQQQQLAKELKTLKRENKQLKNQTNSQKKQLSGISSNVNKELNRVQISGFGRLAWDNDNIKGYVDRNDNRRTYLDLHGKLKVNDKWSFNFQTETNQRYAKYVNAAGEMKYHNAHDDEDGVIQRIWADGVIGKDLHIEAGRKWRGLGFQNILFGNESDGVVVDYPVNKTGLRASAFYMTPTDKGYHFGIYGAGVQGQIGHGLQINAAFAKVNKGRYDTLGTNPYDKTTTYKIKGSDITINDLKGNLKGGGTLKWWGSKPGEENYGEFNKDAGFTLYYAKGLTGNVDVDIKDGELEQVNTYKEYQNTAGSYGFVLSAMWNPLKNICLIGDYAKTNAADYVAFDYVNGQKVNTKYDKHDYLALRLNYRWSNINDPGSFQLYTRYYNYAKNPNGLVGIFGDKEWGLLQPGSHGWVVGFKYVPVKNVEWETMYEYATAQNTLYGHKNESYHRNFIRTQVDFHF